MGWERGRYYTRSRREGGRVVREYVGGGPAGALIARSDAMERDRSETDRQMLRLEVEKMAALDAPLDDLDDLADLIAQAALLAAGFRQHNRGDWRKCRARAD